MFWYIIGLIVLFFIMHYIITFTQFPKTFRDSMEWGKYYGIDYDTIQKMKNGEFPKVKNIKAVGSKRFDYKPNNLMTEENTKSDNISITTMTIQDVEKELQRRVDCDKLKKYNDEFYNFNNKINNNSAQRLDPVDKINYLTNFEDNKISDVYNLLTKNN